MNDTTKYPVPQSIKDLAQQALAAALAEAEIVQHFTIENAQDAEVAATQLRALATFGKEWGERRLELTRPVDQLKKDITGEFSPAIEKAAEAERILRTSLLEWQRKEQARIEAERKAEEARIEAARKEAEERAQREAERAAKLKTPEARERAEERASQAAAEADELAVTAPVVAQQKKLAGVGLRETWKFTVTDKAALIAAAAANPKLAMYLSVDETQVGQVVRAMKGNTDIPGIRAYADQGLSVRR